VTQPWDDQSKAKQLAAYLESIAKMCQEYAADEPVPHFVLDALQRAMGEGWAADLLSRNHFVEPHVKPLRDATGVTPDGVGPMTCGELRWHAGALASVLKAIIPARSAPRNRPVTMPIQPMRRPRDG
jgi:hypothetical protein